MKFQRCIVFQSNHTVKIDKMFCVTSNICNSINCQPAVHRCNNSFLRIFFPDNCLTKPTRNCVILRCFLTHLTRRYVFPKYRALFVKRIETQRSLEHLIRQYSRESRNAFAENLVCRRPFRHRTLIAHSNLPLRSVNTFAPPVHSFFPDERSSCDSFLLSVLGLRSRSVQHFKEVCRLSTHSRVNVNLTAFNMIV